MKREAGVGNELEVGSQQGGSGTDGLLPATISHGLGTATPVLCSLHKHFPATPTRSLGSKPNPHSSTIKVDQQLAWCWTHFNVVLQMPFVKKVKSDAYFSRFQVKYRRRREGKTDCE